MDAAVSSPRERRFAALAALAAHDRLRQTIAREPDHATEPDRWLEWHAAEYRPAYAAWDGAMCELYRVGYTGSRHPYSFRPWCSLQ